MRYKSSFTDDVLVNSSQNETNYKLMFDPKCFSHVIDGSDLRLHWT